MNEFIQVELTYPTHPKTARLRLRHGSSVVAHLLLLWNACGLQYPRGIVPPGDIETLAEWPGEPGAFLRAISEEYYNADTGELSGWTKRSGRVLTEIDEKHEERKKADRERKAKIAAAEKAAEERERLEREGGSVPHDSAEFRTVPHDSAELRTTKTKTRTKTDPDPPPALDLLPDGQRAGAGAREGAAPEVEDPRLTPLIDRLVAGVRRHLSKGCDDVEPHEERRILAGLVRRPREGLTPEEFCEDLLEVMPKVAASGEWGVGEKPPGRKTKWLVSSSADLATVVKDALVLYPSTKAAAARREAAAARPRFVEERTGRLQMERRRELGLKRDERLSIEVLAEIDAQVAAETDRRFGPGSRAGPAPPAPPPLPQPPDSLTAGGAHRA